MLILNGVFHVIKILNYLVIPKIFFKFKIFQEKFMNLILKNKKDEI